MSLIRESCFLALVVICFCTKTTLGCGGYSVNIKELKNCVEGGVISISEGFSVELDKKCNIVAHGCASIKSFSTLDLGFTFDKKPFSDIRGNVDVCELAREAPLLTKILGSFGLPTNCPVKEQIACPSETHRFNIRFLRPFLNLAVGEIHLRLEATHDSGTTCINANFDIVKE